MSIEDKNIIWLDLFSFLSYQKKVKLLNLFPVDKDIKKLFTTNVEVKNLLNDIEYNKMIALLDDNYLDSQIEKFISSGIQMITINNDKYPLLLKQITTPPLCLYCKGNIDLLNSYCVAVVGSRKATEYGELVTKQYVKEFCKAGLTVVSGLAYGIDTFAHKTTLAENGKTIAVLAGGLYHTYPASNINLSNQITENGLLISENSPNIIAQAYHFPIRNRIIAGLSHAILIPEASLKSGSLHTKNYALEYNRDVFVVPGRINSPASEGTNNLIKEYPICVTLSPDDMLERMGIQKIKNEKNTPIQLDINKQLVLDYIKSDKKTFQQILEYSRLSTSELNIMLMSMEMEGLITKCANNSYIASML